MMDPDHRFAERAGGAVGVVGVRQIQERVEAFQVHDVRIVLVTDGLKQIETGEGRRQPVPDRSYIAPTVPSPSSANLRSATSRKLPFLVLTATATSS
jgi:hypothetical protein